MKGTPQYPMCGFSSRAVQALMAAGAVTLRTVNVLEEPEIRANLPRFSNLPTFPQLFINGELIGGCDIVPSCSKPASSSASSKRRPRDECGHRRHRPTGRSMAARCRIA